MAWKTSQDQPASDGGAEPRREPPRDRRPPSRAGDIDVGGLPPDVRSAVGRLVDEVDRLRADLDRARRKMRELQSVADEDPLLPVLNRRGFVRELGRAIAFCTRYGTRAALVYLDLDGFKAVNDRHGHAAGDALLAGVAQAICANVRASDIVGRLGGDEFAVLLWQAAPDDAARKAEAIASAVAAVAIRHDGAALSATASAGCVAVAPEDTAETALRRADAAMYAVKRANRD